jgi:hypothetical protein
MVRILNTHFATIFVQHKVLKGNQFAGLPGSSTFEPIHIINEIIEDAKEKHNDLWILFQDMSKAYDRVNIFMLKKAMARLRLPSSFIDLICYLFTQHKNRVFTSVGTTSPYDVLIGIDQGEVISLLLWCIYYDPLLCEIEQLQLGYKLEHSYKQNVYVDNLTSISHTTSTLAFMDDTSWIASSQYNLECILSIADSFNILNNIKVNKEKSELLVNSPDVNNNDKEQVIVPLDLVFGNTTIKIQPAQKGESIRFLGVWINLKKKRNFVIQQAKDEVSSMCETLKRKKITDKQLLYLYNMVIIPRIEYRTQITFLSKQDCDNIVIPFRKLFKHKLKMASSMPNAILENHYIYKFRDLWEVQSQSKITNFSVQINDLSSLRIITNIRLRQLQHLECLTQSPIVEWPYISIQRRYYTSFLASSISLCRFNNISFECPQHLCNHILEGTISIHSLLTHQ